MISAEKSLSLRRNCIAKWRRGLIDKVGKNLSHKNSITLAREMQASLPSHGIRIFSFIINGKRHPPMHHTHTRTTFVNRSVLMLFLFLQQHAPSASLVVPRLLRRSSSSISSSWDSFDYGADPKALFSDFPAPSPSTPTPTPVIPDLPQSSIQPAIDVLAPFLQPARLEKLQSVLAQRNFKSTFLFENPVNPSNVFACLRTLDSYGFQDVNIISSVMEEEESMNETRRKQFGAGGSGKMLKQTNRGARTAAGAAQWLDVKVHSDISVVNDLKAKGYKIFVSTLAEGSVDIRDVFSNENGNNENDNSKKCFVMGNEESGVSEEMTRLADVLFHIPMKGFAESYNLSVATALTCAYLSASENAVVKAADVSGEKQEEEERERLLLRWIVQSLPKRGMGEAILRREGILASNNSDNATK